MSPNPLSSRELNNQKINTALKKLSEMDQIREVTGLIRFLNKDIEGAKDCNLHFIYHECDPIIREAYSIMKNRMKLWNKKKSKNSKRNRHYKIFKHKKVFHSIMDRLMKVGMFDKNSQYISKYGDKQHMIAVIRILVDDGITIEGVDYSSLYEYFREFHGVPKLSDLHRRRKPQLEAVMREVIL